MSEKKQSKKQAENREWEYNVTKEELKQFFDAGFAYRHEGEIDFEKFLDKFIQSFE